MNIIFTVIFLSLFSSICFCQTIEELNNKFEDQQAAIGEQERRMEKIQNNLMQHSKRYSTGVGLLVASSIAGAIAYSTNSPFFMISSGILGISGIVVIIDSHKFFKRAGTNTKIKYSAL